MPLTVWAISCKKSTGTSTEAQVVIGTFVVVHGRSMQIPTKAKYCGLITTTQTHTFDLLQLFFLFVRLSFNHSRDRPNGPQNIIFYIQYFVLVFVLFYSFGLGQQQE
jgi:hypothetical protein